jgi:Zn-dependent peptidase ImmA (M78 family)
MSFIRKEIQQAVDIFWQNRNPSIRDYPLQLESILWMHRLEVIQIPNLDVNGVYTWLNKQNAIIPNSVRGQSRAIFGCLVAYGGAGYIFVDSNANGSEKLFTIGHEIGHFIRDYLFPRKKAFTVFGKSIEDVLNGVREPTAEERVRGILSNVNVNFYTDLLLRDENNQIVNDDTNVSEIMADAIALELIAPHRMVLEKSKVISNRHLRQYIETETLRSLIEYFNLPEKIAYIYSMRIAQYFQKQETVKDWLNL